MHNLLYWYEERIPVALQEMVLASIPRNLFAVDKMTYLTNRSEQLSKLAWAEVVLFAPGRYLDDEQLDAARHIKLMQLWSSGYDKFNLAGATAHGIPIANNGGANAGSVAEHAVLLMLAVYKWLPDSHRRAVTGSWAGNSHGLDMYMMEGKRAGIIGFGNIGRQVACKLRGFDMQVSYFDLKRAPEDLERELGVSYASFEEILATSDIITLHLHSNVSTRNIIGAAELAKMRPGAVLINVSRAELVDQDALTEALAAKRLHGAGVDVFLKEPTTGAEPLLQLPFVVATPHMAGSTYDVYAKALANCVANCRRAVKGEPLQWVANPDYAKHRTE